MRRRCSPAASSRESLSGASATRPPYGYTLEAHPHPNPNKAREDKRKHRLTIDPVRAPIILMIFEDYCLHSLGLGELCHKLNSDFDRYPSPQPNRPIISTELFEMVEDRARGNEAKVRAGMVRTHAPSNKHRPGRFYPLRGRVRCGLCGHSMEGCHQAHAS